MGTCPQNGVPKIVYLSWLPPKEGAKFMLTVFTLFNGLFHSASSNPAIQEELAKKDIDIFSVDLKSNMINSIIILLEGIHVVILN
ncbi:MAG: hypothetical protein GY874_16655 [Desulfobacteraceae bacterium]|nr:hypothetical protein [Desulfobacteraceae bacterium]